MTTALHDLNNVLTALHLALHLAQSKVARLADSAATAERDAASEQAQVQLRRSVHLVDRAGDLARSLREAWDDGRGRPGLDRAAAASDDGRGRGERDVAWW